jgi:hypothetical protein
MFPTYKDMTFCTATECIHTDCHRHMRGYNYTPTEEDKYVAMSNFSKTCDKYATDKQKECK